MSERWPPARSPFGGEGEGDRPPADSAAAARSTPLDRTGPAGDVVVTGAGQVVLGGALGELRCDPVPLLRERKARKYLGLQDDMAVVAAGRALESAGLSRDLGERAGLYLSVGYIPFLVQDIEPVLEASLQDGRFSMERFSTEGRTRAHPLITFRCLPNMPAYHVSQTFDLQGPYLVTYPGVAQVYLALEEAVWALTAGEIDVALVGGVAAQRNFLVEHHHRRIEPPVPAERLRDAAGFLVLERAPHAADRGARALCTMEGWQLDYRPFDPRHGGPAPDEAVEADGAALDLDGELGAASLAVALGRALACGAARVVHRLRSRDGVTATSAWRRVP